MRVRIISASNFRTLIVDVFSYSVVLRFRRCSTRKFGLAKLEGYGGGWIVSLIFDRYGRLRRGTRPPS